MISSVRSVDGSTRTRSRETKEIAPIAVSPFRSGTETIVS